MTEQVPLMSVRFTGVSTGFVAGGNLNSGFILKTTDGGASWTPQVPGMTNVIWGLDFPDRSTGYAVGFNGSILKASEGGTGIPGNPRVHGLLSVYPNPSSGMVTIETPEAEQHAVLILYDIAGREVMRTKMTSLRTRLDLTAMPKGIYLAICTSATAVYTGRVIRA